MTVPAERVGQEASACPLARAAARTLGLDEGCYEVLLSEVLRREAPKGHPNEAGLLADFGRDMALLGKLSALPPDETLRESYERYYRRGVERCVPLTQSGQWWRALLIERVAFRRIERSYPQVLEEGALHRV
ncbi:MAG: hypothetical protein M3R38_04140 [Actinomycetota bacterium]|nr:hypothetical protein [Actinomycetota bacterium]